MQCSQTFLVSTVIPTLMKLLQEKLMCAISFTSNIKILTVKTLIILKFKSNFLGLKWKFSFGINNGENGHMYTDNSVRHELSQSTFQAGRT